MGSFSKTNPPEGIFRGQIEDFLAQIRRIEGRIVNGGGGGGRLLGEAEAVVAGWEGRGVRVHDGDGSTVAGDVVRESDPLAVNGIRGLLDEVDAIRVGDETHQNIAADSQGGWGGQIPAQVEVDHAIDPVEVRRNARAVEGAGNALRATDQYPVGQIGSDLLKQSTAVREGSRESCFVGGLTEFAVHPVVDSREFPNAIFLNEQAAAGIAVGKVARVRPAIAVKDDAQRVADADTEIRDPRDVVLAPALDTVGRAPEPAVGLSAYDDGRAALRAAAEDDEMFVGFIRRGIQPGVTWKSMAHPPDRDRAVEGLESGEGMIGKPVEEEDVIGRAADVVGDDEELRGDGRAEKIEPEALVLPAAVGENACRGRRVEIRIVRRLEEHRPRARRADYHRGNTKAHETQTAAQSIPLNIHNELVDGSTVFPVSQGDFCEFITPIPSPPAYFLDAVFADGLAFSAIAVPEPAVSLR